MNTKKTKVNRAQETNMRRAGPKTGQKMGNSLAGKNKRRQAAAATNLAQGMNTEEALVDAGYSPITARKNGYAIVREPYIQSILTESCQRIMHKRQIDFDGILEPLFDALKANIVIKVARRGKAVQTNVVDHATRMEATGRLVDLHRLNKRGDAEGDEKQPVKPVVLNVHFIDPPKKQDSQPLLIDPPKPAN